MLCKYSLFQMIVVLEKAITVGHEVAIERVGNLEEREPPSVVRRGGL